MRPWRPTPSTPDRRARVIVRCGECALPVRSRADLDVVGRALTPLHRTCRGTYARRRPWYRRSWPITRTGPWLAVIAVAAALLLATDRLAPQLDGRLPVIVVVAAFAWLVLGRVVAYAAIERHLPRRAPAGGD